MCINNHFVEAPPTDKVRRIEGTVGELIDIGRGCMLLAIWGGLMLFRNGQVMTTEQEGEDLE